jgi:hypothetical protein
MNDKLNCLYDGNIRFIIVNREYHHTKLANWTAYISVGHMELGPCGTIFPLEQRQCIKQFMTISKKERDNFNKRMKKVKNKIKLSGKYGIYNDIFDDRRQYEVYYFNQMSSPGKK